MVCNVLTTHEHKLQMASIELKWFKITPPSKLYTFLGDSSLGCPDTMRSSHCLSRITILPIPHVHTQTQTPSKNNFEMVETVVTVGEALLGPPAHDFVENGLFCKDGFSTMPTDILIFYFPFVCHINSQAVLQC